MKKHSFLAALTAVATLAGFLPVTRASGDLLSPNIVTPNDTFNIAVVGYNTTEQIFYFAVSPLTVTFTGTGVGQTFAAAGPNGQTVTVTTTQTTAGGNITDSISIGVPTNFVPDGTTTASGAVVNNLRVYMGYDAAGTNTLNFTPALTGVLTFAGTYTYNNGTFALNPVVTLSNADTSLAYREGVTTTNTTGISPSLVRAFSFSITYPAVPEPSTWALCALGVAGGAGLVLRRRRAQA